MPNASLVKCDANLLIGLVLLILYLVLCCAQSMLNWNEISQLICLFIHQMLSPIVTENDELNGRLESLSEVDNETEKFFEAAFWSVSTELTTPSVSSDDDRVPDGLDVNVVTSATTRRLVFAAKSSASQRPQLDIAVTSVEVNKQCVLVPSSAEDDVDGFFWGNNTTSG